MYTIHFSLSSSDMYLSFEFSSYSLNEMGTYVFPINIIKQKENATATENTYELTVQLKSKSEMLTSEDFIADSAELKIHPNQEKVIYSFTIKEDGVPEEEESFILGISPVTNRVQWLNGDNVTTIINIIDDDGKKMLKQDYENVKYNIIIIELTKIYI